MAFIEATCLSLRLKTESFLLLHFESAQPAMPFLVSFISYSFMNEHTVTRLTTTTTITKATMRLIHRAMKVFQYEKFLTENGFNNHNRVLLMGDNLPRQT